MNQEESGYEHNLMKSLQAEDLIAHDQIHALQAMRPLTDDKKGPQHKSAAAYSRSADQWRAHCRATYNALIQPAAAASC
jgi:hypothetical protein